MDNIILFLSLLSAFATIIYIIFGVYILIRRPYAPLHRVFFLMCISLSLWAFGFFAITYTKNEAVSSLYYKIQYTGAITYCVFTLKFIIYLSDLFKKKYIRWIIFAVSYILPVIFLYQNWGHNMVRLDYPDGFWYQGIRIYPNIYDAVCLLTAIVWAIHSKSKRNRKQGIIILSWALVTLPITHSADIFARANNLPCPAGIFVLIWVSSLFYCTVKYQMFETNPQYVLREITKNIESIIILYNPYGYRTWSNIEDNKNEKLKAVLKHYTKLDNIVGKKMAIMSYDIKNNQESININRPFVNSDDIIYCTVTLKYVFDLYGDFLGTMVAVTQYEKDEPLLFKKRLSKREQQVAVLLISGLTYNQISKELYITKNTLKTHITSCYNKLGVNNKIEMINIINDNLFNTYN